MYSIARSIVFSDLCGVVRTPTCLLFACRTDLTHGSKGVVFSLWLWIFARSIPVFIDGSLFKAPYVPEEPTWRKPTLEVEKGRETLVGGHTDSLSSGET